MYKRILTLKSERILEIAKSEAQKLGSSIGPQHILLGILKEAPGNAAKVLNLAGITLDKLDLSDPVWRVSSSSSEFGKALTESFPQELEHGYGRHITPEHLLLAVSNPAYGDQGITCLRQSGAVIDSVKATTLRFMGDDYKDVGTPYATKPAPDPDSGWIAAAPASEQAVKTLLNASALALPNEYLQFLSLTNGGGGGLDINPWVLELWTAEEVLDLNESYGLREYIPGYFGIGSSGGGECFVFDTRQPDPWRVFIIPFIGMEEDCALLLANSFSELLEHVVPGCDTTDYMETMGEELRNN